MLAGFLTVYSWRYNVQKSSEEYTLKRYVTGRFLRIYPSYICALFLTIIVDIATKTIFPSVYNASTFTVNNFISNILMLQNLSSYAFTGRLGILDTSTAFMAFGSSAQFWTMSSDWWCHIAFGLLVCGYKKYKRRAEYWLFLLIALYIASENLIKGTMFSSTTSTFIMGMLVYFFVDYLSERHVPQHTSGYLLIAIISFILAHLRIWRMFQYYGALYDPLFATLCACSFGSMLLFCKHATITVGSITKKVILFFSQISYPVYLCHHCLMTFFFGAATYSKISFKTAAILTFLVSNILAFMMSVVMKKVDEKLKVKLNFNQK